MKKTSLACIFAALLMGLALMLVWAQSLVPDIHGLQLSSPGHTPQPIGRYWLQASDPGRDDFSIAGTIDYHAGQSTLLHITPDNCLRGLRINDTAVPQEPHTGDLSCDYKKGIDYDIKPYLHAGKNTLAITLWDDSHDLDGYASLDLFFRWPAAVSFAFIAVFCATLATLWLFIGLDGKSAAILTGAMLLYAWHICDSGYAEFAYDIEAHIDYALYILQHLVPPRPDAAWEYYQPPLYYYIAALAGTPAQHWGYTDFLLNLRTLSLLCFTGFITYGALILRRTVPAGALYYLALFLLAFWPVGTVMAGRINNDILLYFFYAAVFYDLTRWHENPRPLLLARALVFAGLAVATKSSGLILFSIIAAALLLARREKFFTFRDLLRREIIIALLCAGVLSMSNIGRTVYFALHQDHTQLELVGNAHLLNKGLRVENTLGHFCGLDFQQFFYPYFNAWTNISGRQYFWGTLIKSATLGEFKWNDPSSATGLNCVLLLMVVYAAALTVYALITRVRFPLIIRLQYAILGLMVASLAMLRLRYPYACSNDFRLIYPALIPFLIIYTHLLQTQRRGKGEVQRLYWLGMLLACTFAVLSFTFVTAQHSEEPYAAPPRSESADQNQTHDIPHPGSPPTHHTPAAPQ